MNHKSHTPQREFSQNSSTSRLKVNKPVMMFQDGLRFVPKLFLETCVICFNDIHPDLMCYVDECGHRFCLTCVKQHIEVKLLDGMIPKCPQHRCKSQLSFVRCDKILTPKLSFMWKQRIREDSIPFSDRVYCPNQRCSYLLSKSELYLFAESGRRRCFKCDGCFCIDCKVPWHSKLTCTDYKKLHPQNDDLKLKSLAKFKRWRQCGKCQHMVERSSGCSRLVCRCGNAFCYKCGASFADLIYCSCDVDAIRFYLTTILVVVITFSVLLLACLVKDI